MREIARGQINVVRRYFSGEGVAALNAAQMPVRPHPDVALLDRLLGDAAIRNALPNVLTRTAPEAGPDLNSARWPETGPTRAAWTVFFLGLGALVAVAYLYAAMRTSSHPG
jgi:hypothetical protein